MCKIYFIICFCLALKSNVKSQFITEGDSSIILKSIRKLDTSSIKVGTKIKDIPKYIIKAIKADRKGFRITGNPNKFANDIYIGRKKINRLLQYIIKAESFFIMAYKHGGVISNSKLFFITIVNGKVDKVYNFIIPEHDNISSLIRVFQAPNFHLKNLTSNYW